MMLDSNDVSVNDARLEWIEPQLNQLDVRETAASPMHGGDGSKYNDCTRS